MKGQFVKFAFGSSAFYGMFRYLQPSFITDNLSDQDVIMSMPATMRSKFEKLQDQVRREQMERYYL